MVNVKIVTADGSSFAIEAANGTTLMENAVRNSVPGIVAECGGACACATCHVYIEEGWVDRVGPANDIERDMLDFASDVRENSRLSCQIKLSEALDGLMVNVPETQS